MKRANRRPGRNRAPWHTLAACQRRTITDDVAGHTHHPVTVLAVREGIPPETIRGRPDLDLRLAMRVIRSLGDLERSSALRSLVGASRFVIADRKRYDGLSSGF